MHVKRAQKGFTLIELVIVIVLIGILAATALPKFADLTGSARTAAAQGVAGALSAAAAVAHAQWIADGGTANVNSITMEGNQTVFVTDTGWPEDTSAPTTSGTTTTGGCANLWTGILNNPPEAAASCTGTCEYEVTVGTNTCIYTDEQGNGTNVITYNVNTGNVSL